MDGSEFDASKKTVASTKLNIGDSIAMIHVTDAVSEITLESDNRKINAKSIMGIMAFNPSDGMSVDIVTKGDDEQEALVAIENFLVCE